MEAHAGKAAISMRREEREEILMLEGAIIGGLCGLVYWLIERKKEKRNR